MSEYATLPSAELEHTAKASIERLAYSPREAAEALGVVHGTIYALIRAGKLRAFKAGKRTLIPVADVRALIGLDIAR